MYKDADIEGEFSIRKALIVPINAERMIYIQDRRGYKKPDWGYFGGSIEGNETPIQAVIRESSEELTIQIKENQLLYLGATISEYERERIIRYMYLYPTEQLLFDVREGNGGVWATFEEASKLLGGNEMFEEVVLRINGILAE